MFDSRDLAALLGSLLAVAGFVALFVIVAGRLARRFGRAGVFAAWVGAAALLALTMIARLQARQAALGLVPNEMRDTWTLVMFTLLSFFAFGAAALVVWRHHRSSRQRTGRMILSGVAAFFGGALAFFVLLLVKDLFNFVRR